MRRQKEKSANTKVQNEISQGKENKHIEMEGQGKVSCSVVSRHLWSNVAKKEKKATHVRQLV